VKLYIGRMNEGKLSTMDEAAARIFDKGDLEAAESSMDSQKDTDPNLVAWSGPSDPRTRTGQRA
jgi:hypothetical protein